MRGIRGFTLIEMLTAAAVGTTLLTAAVPSFSQALARHRLTATVNELLMAIDSGRGRALASGERIVLAPVADGDWASGWLLYEDLNDNGVRDEGEPVLRVFDRPAPRTRFELVGNPARATMSFQEQGLIRRAGSNGLMLGRMVIRLDGNVRTLCFAAARVRVVANRDTCP